MHSSAAQSLTFFEDLTHCSASSHRRPAARWHSLAAWKRAHRIRTRHTATSDPSVLPWCATTRDGQLARGRSERHACARLAHDLAIPYLD